MQSDQKRLAVYTLGCRLNQYESEKMAADLVPFGFMRVDEGEADLCLINTCTVTHRADADCRNLIRKVVREHPASRIVVSGCYVDNDPANAAGMEGVDAIIRNSEKQTISSILPQKFPELFTSEPDKNCSTAISEFRRHSRAWVKVSDGCNQWCSYCIIPTVRGRLRNRPVSDVLEEIQQLVANGYKEVVLTGVNLGHYKNRTSEPQVRNLAELCRLILAKTDLHRLHLSSLEPQTVREELVAVYTESGNRLCRHMHLPMQSGSSRILKLMQRPYDQATYLKRLESVRAARANTIIGADVIVGFPSETEADFAETIKVAESGLIDYLHVFSYSDRRGTPASTMSEKVSPEIIKERSAILTRLSGKLRRTAHERQIGQTLEVIPEYHNEQNGQLYGMADNYIRVRLNRHPVEQKPLLHCRIIAAYDGYVDGEVVKSPASCGCPAEYATE